MYIKYFQIVVLGFSLIGTAFVFFNSPFVDDSVWLRNESEMKILAKKNKKKRRLARIGFGLILLSYLFQTLITFYTHTN